ncbi:membrane-bound lytic murein transglycosylase MltF [Methylovorus sp. MM2]|uniref:membrane-bound lytic murein transglycosylase MltF n=1 Tax=Methylovorus sp. MM2 TaxID=1848038 RepID=UPI0009EF6CA2|nr:membrane-bound lytic murein transglycosylase MltF [Methylovorus sp. MM2]
MRLFFIFILLAMLQGCDQPPKPLPDAQLSKELIVVTHNGPNTYYVNGEGQYAGLEYDLVKLFVKELGPEYSVKFLIVDNISQVVPTLTKGKAHFAAADLSITPEREKLVKFSIPYQSVQQKVVYNSSQKSPPKKINDLADKSIAVPAGTSYAERLKNLSQKEPGLKWQQLSNTSADELLEQVAEGNLDYTISDGHLVSMLQNYYPNLEAGMSLGDPESIAWAFPENGQPWIHEKANVFFKRIIKDGTLHSLLDRYYGHTERLNPVDITSFLQRSRNILPQYINTFKQAQELTNVDWRLLAAISYQESHWDRFNTSPTNVRGMMMLTEDTADLLGVNDRLDAKQSILGGARYIVMLKDLIPARIEEPDRTWLALAAYNIGYAHLEDARVLAQRMKLNPDSWADLKKTLPLLNKAEYYSTVKYGFARGGAPVVFVESIRTYHKVLERYEQQHTPLLPNFNLVDSGFNNNFASNK